MSCLAGITPAAKPRFPPVSYRLVRSTALTTCHLHSRITSLVYLASAGQAFVTKLWLKDVTGSLSERGHTHINQCFTLAKLSLPRREKN